MLLKIRGLAVSPGTLVGVLGRVLVLLRLLYAAIVAYNREEGYIHADETG